MSLNNFSNSTFVNSNMNPNVNSLTAGSLTVTSSGGGSGSISADQLALSATNSTLTKGVVKIDNLPFLHNYNQTNSHDNTFVGSNSGLNTAAMTAASQFNLGAGSLSLQNLTSGSSNSCSGYRAGRSLTSGSANSFCGAASGDSATTANQNSCLGANAGQGISTGGNNCSIGAFSMGNGGNVTGSSNSCVGSSSMGSGALSGSFNNALGASNQGSLSTGNFNTSAGHQALINVSSGSNIIGLGAGAGSVYTNETNNICIDNVGVVADANTTRIGTAQTDCFIAGTVHSSGLLVPTTGGTPSNLTYYEESPVNSTNWTNTIIASSNINFVRVGKVVTAQISGVTPILTSAGSTIQGVGAIPARFRPATPINLSILVDNDSPNPGIPQLAVITINAADITIYGTATTGVFLHTLGVTSAGFHAVSLSWIVA